MILLVGYFGYGNLGDEAILAVWVSILRKKKELVVLSGAPERTRRWHSVQAVPKKGFFSALRKANILLFPGGSLFQDKTSFRSNLFYASVVFTARALGKPVFFYGQGIGPFRYQASAKLAIASLQKATLLTVRDRTSMRFCQENHIPARLARDAALLLPQAPLCKEHYVFVPYKREDQLKKVLLEISRHWVQFLFHPRHDLPLFKNQPVASWNKILNPFQNASFVFACRYHAALFALSAQVPLLIYGDDPKLKALAEENNIPRIEHLVTSNAKELASSCFEKAKAVGMEGEALQEEARGSLQSFQRALFG